MCPPYTNNTMGQSFQEIRHPITIERAYRPKAANHTPTGAGYRNQFLHSCSTLNPQLQTPNSGYFTHYVSYTAGTLLALRRLRVLRRVATRTGKRGKARPESDSPNTHLPFAGATRMILMGPLVRCYYPAVGRTRSTPVAAARGARPLNLAVRARLSLAVPVSGHHAIGRVRLGGPAQGQRPGQGVRATATITVPACERSGAGAPQPQAPPPLPVSAPRPGPSTA